MKKFGFGLLSAALVLSSVGPLPAAADQGEEKRVIVVFEEDASDGDKDDAVGDAGGKLTESYGEVPVAAAEVPEHLIDNLAADPDVKSVEEDVLVKLSYQQEDWGVRSTNVPAAWATPFTGKGIKISVIDSGIARHEDLTISGGISTVDYTSSYADDQGHGTHVAGTIAARNNGLGVKGVAFNSQIYAVKAFNKEGNAFLSDIIEGIDWSIANGMDIVNISAGTKSDSPAFKAAADKAYGSGMLIVAAAGNDGTSDGAGDTVSYPARYSSVIGVAAVDRYGQRADFSSTGPAVEVAAPGVHVLSTYIGNKYAYSDGTSMATPYVSGMLALMMEAYPRHTNKELRQMLIERTRDLGPAGRDAYFGYGLIQASSFTEVRIPEAENVVTSLKSSILSVSGAPGESKQVTVTASYKDGTVKDVTSQALWTSSNSSVADVSSGRISLKGYGSATITASFSGKSVSISVNVPDSAVSVQTNTSKVTGSPGEERVVTASVTMKSGAVKDITQSAVWTSSNPDVATVQAGRILLKGYGASSVTALYDGRSATVLVDVPNPIIALGTSMTAVTGTPGDIHQLAASAHFKSGATKDVTQDAVWSSGNPAVATVEAGKITLTGYGTTTVTVKYENQSTTITIRVPKPEPQPEEAVSMEVSQSEVTGAIGDTAILNLLAQWSDGTEKDITAEAVWQSADESVAAVNEGRVILTGYGQTSISAVFGDLLVLVQVIVPEPEPEPAVISGIAVSESAVQGETGGTASLMLTGTWSDGTTGDLTAEAVWQSGDENVATVDGGRVTFTGYGQTVITAEAGGHVALVQVTVPQPEEYFSDVSSDFWAFEEITHLKENGIITGYEDATYRPGNTIRRDHVAHLFSKSVPLTAKVPATPFSDVPADYVYYSAITKVQQAGIFSGSGGKFGPKQQLTRGQMAKILVLAYGLQGSTAHPFTDVSSDHWADDYIGILYQNGITTGSDGEFKPEDNVTRAQYAVFLYRAMKLSELQ